MEIKRLANAALFNKTEVKSSPRILVEIIAIAVFFILLSYFLGKPKMTDFMIFVIAVLSYDLIYGYMGHLTIGHMLYFGTGTYTSALFMKLVTPNPLLGITAGILAGAVVAAIVGSLVVRTKGSTFALVNMAFNYVGFFMIAYAWADVTGGEDGMASFTGTVGSINLQQHPLWFYFVLLCLLATFFLLKKLAASPFGVMVKSIKHNETRIRFLGYNVHYYKLVTFIIASALAAFAGTLTTINYGYIAPDYVSPLRNEELIFANLIGGAGNIYGALVGGTLYMVMKDYLSIYVERWELVLGILLVVISLRFRSGIVGFLKKHVQLRSGSRG